MVTLGAKAVLSDKFRRGALLVLRDLEMPVDSPDCLKEMLGKAGIDTSTQRVMIITASPHHKLISAKRKMAGRAAMAETNHSPSTLQADGICHGVSLLLHAAAVHAVTIFGAGQATVLDLANHHVIVLDLAAVNELQSRLSTERVVSHRPDKSYKRSTR